MIPKKEIERLPAEREMAMPMKEVWGMKLQRYGDCIIVDVYNGAMIMSSEKGEKNGEFQFRWATDKKNYYTYHPKEGRWRNRTIDYEMNGWRGGSINAYTDQQSQDIAEEYLQEYLNKWSRRDAASLIRCLQDDMRRRKNEDAKDAREQRIKRRQEKRGELPKDWQEWLAERVFRYDNYVFYDAKKRKTGTCSHCLAEIPLEKKKHKEMGICPNCKRQVRYRAKGYGEFVSDGRQVIYIERIEDAILVRCIKSVKMSTPKGEMITWRDLVLSTITSKKVYRDYNIGWTAEEWTDARPAEMSLWTETGDLYTRGLKEQLAGTPYQYAPMDIWASCSKKSQTTDFLWMFGQCPWMEYALKMGLKRLVEECVDRGIKIAPTRPGAQLKRLERLNGGILMLSYMSHCAESKMKVTDEELQWLDKNAKRPQEGKIALDKMHRAGKTATRMINYIEKQRGLKGDVIRTWIDYLQMAEAEGMDMTDDIVLFPKNLRLRHDDLVNKKEEENDQQRLLKNAELEEKVKERLPEMERYRWTGKEYIITPAQSIIDLMQEGRSLHHCVGRNEDYMKKMANGKTWILFLRRKESPDEPYYTIEIDVHTDEIIQWYSEFDRKPDRKTIEKVLKTFTRRLKKAA